MVDAASRRNITPFGFSFFRVSYRTKFNFSLIITRVNIHHHLLIKLQKRCYATALLKISLQLRFPEAILLHAAKF